MRYADFVDYSTLDPFKERIIEALGPTWANTQHLGVRVMPESLGQPAVLLDARFADGPQLTTPTGCRTCDSSIPARRPAGGPGACVGAG